MKIAITADVHIKTNKEYPERFNALKNILDQLLKENIDNLIIAGDLFDLESQNYAVFDELCKDKKYSDIKFYVVPGNHDLNINSKYFTSKNINIFSTPKVVTFNNSAFSLFFIPYIPGKSMGEVMAAHKEIIPESWILIGHGDYLSGIREINTYETTGVYMPLARSDIEYYNPSKVILGHIHKKTGMGKVLYPGSPCGMDINETGKRSFFILDLNDLSITEKTVDTEYIFFNETLIALPTFNEFDYTRNKIKEIVKGFNLSKDEISKARIRLKVKGYTSDKKKLETAIKESLADFSFYDNEGPDLSEVSLFNDPERINIVERVKEKIDLLDKNSGYTQVKKDKILEQALSVILQE